MKNVSILEDDDVVLETDWCRPLQLETMNGGHSDYYSFENCYSSNPENNVKWCRINQLFNPVLYEGDTVKQYNKRRAYEFIRGDIPWTHQYGKTKPEIQEEYLQYLASTILKIGKYKGRSFLWVKTNDNYYFTWARDNSIIKTESEYLRNNK